MGKHTKIPVGKAPKKAKRRKDCTLAELSDQVHQTLQDELEHLLDLRAGIKRALDSGDATPALVRESAGVSRAVATLSAEIRAQEKHERAADKNLSPADFDSLVVAYLEEIPAKRRLAIIEQLGEIVDDTHLLAH
jgi:hypothetical protein